MAVAIVIANGVAVSIGVTIETLRIRGIGYNSIWTDPTPYLRIVPPGPHLHQLNVTVGPLTGKGEVGDQGAGDPALLAVGQIARLGYQCAGDVDC
jgi:hypothetical protein